MSERLGKAAARPRVLCVTGTLAEPALRRVLAGVAEPAGIDPRVAVLPITVAALLTTDWVARHLAVPPGIARVILPGYCRGDCAALEAHLGVPVELGPRDLRDLPEFLGQKSGRPRVELQAYDLEILAEINHAPRLERAELLRQARRLHAEGADWIDLGCDPGSTWSGLAEAVHALRDAGLRVSIDSLNAEEIAAGARAGAELVLSVNGTNREAAPDWGIEVVAIPDRPADLAGLEDTLAYLDGRGVRFRIDPIVEPIGLGFAASLGRYLEVRRRFPQTPMLMGVGNLTELTDVDSAGINVLLAGFCQELGPMAILTTEVAPWCQSSVRELDRARRLVHYAVSERLPPKRVLDDLIMLRDPRRTELSAEELAELATRIRDRNYRLFAAQGRIHVLNGQMALAGDDPFRLFAEIESRDAKMTPDHAFYLGYEMAKAVTALTLGKPYVQDQALRWGMLTVAEPDRHASGAPGPTSEERSADGP